MPLTILKNTKSSINNIKCTIWLFFFTTKYYKELLNNKT